MFNVYCVEDNGQMKEMGTPLTSNGHSEGPPSFCKKDPLDKMSYFIRTLWVCQAFPFRNGVCDCNERKLTSQLISSISVGCKFSSVWSNYGHSEKGEWN